MSLSRISACLTPLRVAGAIGLLLGMAALHFWQPLAGQDAHALLQRALAAVRSADGFTVDMRYTQRQAGLVAGRDNVLELAIRGQVQGTDKARFTFSAPFAQGGRSDADQEYLLADGLVYQRVGEQWQRVDELPASEQMAGGGLSLAAAASDVTALPAQETELGRYERIAFALATEDVLRFLLGQAGSLTPESLALARLGAPRMEGSGELWIDPAGLPARLILDLSVQQAGEQTPTLVHTVATYSGFGAAFPPGAFDPTASAATSLPLPEKDLERVAPLAAMFLVGALGLGFLALLFLRRRRWATQAVTAVVLVGLLTPPLHGAAQAVQPQRNPAAVAAASTPPGAALAQLLDETRALSNQLQYGIGPSFQLAENSDYDFDGIPNGVELQLGTNPFVADTDQDGLTDFQEITGFPCGNNKWVETDPLNPDSNGDGVNDGAEFHRGQCNSSNSTVPNAWNDDNDGDDVPDWLDLSPFTASGMLAGEKKAGPSFTFETLDQNPGARQIPIPTTWISRFAPSVGHPSSTPTRSFIGLSTWKGRSRQPSNLAQVREPAARSSLSPSWRCRSNARICPEKAPCRSTASRPRPRAMKNVPRPARPTPCRFPCCPWRRGASSTPSRPGCCTTTSPRRSAARPCSCSAGRMCA
jgi:hypothetical protein